LAILHLNNKVYIFDLLKQRAMNKIILVKLFLAVNITAAFCQTDFASYKPKETEAVNQNFFYEVRSKYVKPVTKDDITKATLLRDFIKGYPVNWITDYVSVNITLTGNGNITTSAGLNEMLTDEQKEILSGIQIGNEITIDVAYTYLHPVKGIKENGNIHTTLTVAPHKHAVFMGAQQQFKAAESNEDNSLKSYLWENGINKVKENIPSLFQKGSVTFTVNESGKICNVKTAVSSGSDSMDKILIDSINNMPDWLPAENANGEKVKHDFELVVGLSGC